MPTQRQIPQPGQESVWDYPRPPRVEPTTKLIRVSFGGILIAETQAAYRVLETSHPPSYYLPQADIRMEYLRRTPLQTVCEFKGGATYWSLVVGERESENAGWGYANPRPGYEAIRNHIAFYASRVDECTVNGEVVTAQPGDFYGGWITSDVVGPFKGAPGTWGW